MYTLTIAPAPTTQPGVTTEHPDRLAAVAALADYITATGASPRLHQLTAPHESYDLISPCDHTVACIATIEPVAGSH